LGKDFVLIDDIGKGGRRGHLRSDVIGKKAPQGDIKLQGERRLGRNCSIYLEGNARGRVPPAKKKKESLEK